MNSLLTTNWLSVPPAHAQRVLRVWAGMKKLALVLFWYIQRRFERRNITPKINRMTQRTSCLHLTTFKKSRCEPQKRTLLSAHQCNELRWRVLRQKIKLKSRQIQLAIKLFQGTFFRKVLSTLTRSSEIKWFHIVLSGQSQNYHYQQYFVPLEINKVLFRSRTFKFLLHQ